MKKTLLILVFSLFTQLAFSQAKLTIDIKFRGIEEGYDHQTKTSVIIDGEVIGTSATTNESTTGSFTVTVPKGSHSLKIVNYSLYEGNWEEHTVENDYSIDCIYEEEHSFKKSEKLYVLFDIDQGTFASWKKPVK